MIIRVSHGCVMGGHHKGTVYHKSVSFKRICSLLVQTTATSSSAYYVIIICLTCHHLHAMSCHAVSSTPTGSFCAPIPCQISNPPLWTAARAPAPGALRWPCVPGCPPRGQTPVARQRLQLLLQSSSLSSA